MKKNLKHLKATTINKKGRLVAIGSTEVEDRSGDNLKMQDWYLDDYLKNPVLQAGHEHAPQFTIGVAKNLKIEDKKLTFEPCFHEETQLARDIKAMYEKGILKAWSVGFLPYALLLSKGDENIEIPEGKDKNELLEISAVAVPANQECLTMAKSYGNKEEKKISNWIKEQKDLEEEVIKEKPFINEHSCRLQYPNKFKKFKRESKISQNGKKYNIIYGITEENKSEEQSYRYDKKIWSELEAKKHCETRKGSKFEPAKKLKKEIKVEKKEDIEKEDKKIEKEEGKGIELKEGRVLSKKNRDLIKKCVLTIKDTTIALEKLVNIVELPIKEDAVISTPEKVKGNSNKGREPKKVKAQNTVELRILQKIAGLSNRGIQKLKNNDK